MSFLGDLVNSIGSGKAPAPPSKPFQRPSGTAVPVHATKVQPKLVPQVAAPVVPPPNTLKRKAEDVDNGRLERSPKAKQPAIASQRNDSRPSTPVVNDNKPATPKPTIITPITSSSAPVKAPPKGSYADILARAKQAQEQRSTSKVGMIKHQATTKEKTSKLAERRREEQERVKNDKAKTDRLSVPRGKGSKKRSPSPVKKTDAVKIPKTARPPLHAPAGYKGTMGSASKRFGDSASARASKRSRYDEYLGTDEDEDDVDGEGYDDGDGYGSDASSDMEAGLDELDREEQLAMKAARDDDAKELALESKLKQEKEQRRKKLAAMAKRGK